MRPRLGLVLLGAAALWACGGRVDAVRAGGGAASDATGGSSLNSGGASPMPGGTGPTMSGGGSKVDDPICFETPRDAAALAVNAETLEMMALTPPGRLVPLTIDLVAVEFDFSLDSTGKKREQLIEERKRQLEPYQAPILERLAGIGARNVSTTWITNSVSATLSARDVTGVLCWPNVVQAQVDAGYWTIAEPPWGAPQVGSAQCPLENGACPAHCFEIKAAPVVDGVACSCTERPVACSREPYGIDDDEPSCRRSTESGATLIFRGLVPDSPDYAGFQACSNIAWKYRDDCSGQACLE